MLWSQGISGDLPSVLMRIFDQGDMAQVHHLLLAQEYWRMKGQAVGVLILNEHPASYIPGMQTAIEAALRGASACHRRCTRRTGSGVAALLLPPEVAAFLLATARLVLNARNGRLYHQIAAVAERAAVVAPPVLSRPRAIPNPARPPEGATSLAETLKFFNGTGGFARNGRGYVVILEDGQPTPASWINVIANDAFGFYVSATGAGCTWAENSRENRLTSWSNDPVTDPATEAFMIRDDESGEVFSPTARPLSGRGRHMARYGMGYSRFEHQAGGLWTWCRSCLWWGPCGSCS